MMRRFGIHFRILVTGVILIGTVTITLGYVGAGVTHNFIRTRFEDRMVFLAKYLALNSEVGILIDERSMLDQLTKNLLAEKDVVRVSVLNTRGEILSEASKNENRKYPVIEAPVVLSESPEEFLVFQWEQNGKKGSREIGKVRIAYTTEGIDTLLSIMKTRFILLSVGLAAVSLLLFYFISRSLTAPVTYLSQAVRKIAKEDLSFRVEPGTLPETRRLALAINAMLDSLEQSLEALDEANQKMIRQKTLAEIGKFSMMVAHEVKNPLGIIKSSMDILKKDIDPSGTTMVEYIEDEILRLNRLIEDFLMFARPSRPNFRSVDVNEMAGECLVRFDIQTADSRVEIVSDIPDTPCFLDVDPDLLGRAIGNILKNAFEANGEKGTIKVTAELDKNDWVLSVMDEGDGISQENMSQIFDPFFTTRSKGTGLGLAYTSQVISAHGGSVFAENRANKGSVFRIRLPIDRTV